MTTLVGAFLNSAHHITVRKICYGVRAHVSKIGRNIVAICIEFPGVDFRLNATIRRFGVMRKVVWRIVFALLLFWPRGSSAELKKVVSIGSNDLNYLFVSINDVAIGDSGAVFVLDSGGFCLKKFDAQGAFVKEVGRQGQGPGDFSNMLADICIDKDIYVHDVGNRRIMRIDQGLEVKGTLRIGRSGRYLARLGDCFYMIAPRAEGTFPEIVRFDEQGTVKSVFFEDRPAFMKGAPPPRGPDWAMWMMYADLVMAVDRDSQEVAVTFRYPGPDNEILLYDKDGRFLRRIKFRHPIAYDFPVFRLKFRAGFPGRSQFISFGSGHFIAPHRLLLEYWIEDYESDHAVGQQNYLLVLDTASGLIVHREQLDPGIRVLYARGDLVCARQEDGDIWKVIIYRLII